MNMTDKELGYQHGKLGLESKYPNNHNYREGFSAGTRALLREIEANRPIDNPHDRHVNADYIGA